VDPHILVGQCTAGALPALVAVHVDQREGFAVLIDQFVEVGGIGADHDRETTPRTRGPVDDEGTHPRMSKFGWVTR
jgi:hypothetical protein